MDVVDESDMSPATDPEDPTSDLRFKEDIDPFLRRGTGAPYSSGVVDRPCCEDIELVRERRRW